MPNLRIERPWLTTYQQAFLYNPQRFTITLAATKIGKTIANSWWLFEQAHSPPDKGDEYLWLAPTYSQAEMVFEDVRRKVAPTHAYAINRSDLTITTPAGGVLRYRTAERPDNLYGPSNIRAIVGDEFTRWRPGVWPVVRSLATARQCRVKLIGNYVGEYNWGHRLAVNNTLDPEWAYFKITAFDAQREGIMSEEEIESARRSLMPADFAALYLCEGTSDPDMLMQWDAITDLFTNAVPSTGLKALTCDVARDGPDSTVIMIWQGMTVTHIQRYQGKKTNETAATILHAAQQEGIPRSRIVIDDDGIGGGVVDLVPGCNRFHNGGRPIDVKGRAPNYANLKTQCSYALAYAVNERRIAIAPGQEDHHDAIAQELSWIRSFKSDHDGKLLLVPKPEVRKALGRSPDYADAMMMRMVIELKGDGIANSVLSQQAATVRKVRRAESIKYSRGY